VKVLTKTEFEQHFAAIPSGSEYVRCEGRELFFEHPEANCINIEYPAKLERLPFFARYLATVGYETVDFRGALIWFTTWSVWNELDEAPGYRIVEAISIAAGQPISFEAGSGYWFRADELEQAVGMLLQPMVFGWDAWYYPNWSYGTGQFFLHVSHDSFVSLVTRTNEFHDRVLASLTELRFDAKPADERHVRRFCKVA